MYISVPKTIEENYKVIAIMGNGRTEQFFWPRKEYGYWIPGCMRPCVLSETYKTKYPQIADIVRKEIQDRKHTIPFCMAPPVSTAIGRDIYPIDPKYNTGLKFLGELFTAYICDPEDVSKIFGVDDDNNYTLNPTILLNNNPSQALISILKSIGFKCGEGNSNESCKTWILENTVKVNDLMKLEPYYKNFKADNCTNCG